MTTPSPFGTLLGITAASLATYATARSLRRLRDERRGWWYLAVSIGAWAFALWSLLWRG
jgi:hypothetical protein